MIAIGMKLQATLAVDDFMPDFDFDLPPFTCKPLLDTVSQQTTSLDFVVRNLNDGELTELIPSLNRYLENAEGLVGIIRDFQDAFERNPKAWTDVEEQQNQNLVAEAMDDFFDSRVELGRAFTDVDTSSDTQGLFGDIVIESNVLESDVKDVKDKIDVRNRVGCGCGEGGYEPDAPIIPGLECPKFCGPCQAFP